VAGDAAMANEFISVARVVKTQGRHGEVAVEVHSAVPDRFREGLNLFALGTNDKGPRRELQVQALWPHKELLVLKFAGVDSISDAEALVGCELQIPREARAALATGWTYVSDLIECAVFDGDRELGKIEDVRFGAGEAPLLIVKAGQKEYEIPFAEAYLESVDLEHKQIKMNLPEGMLSVNAPLTEEEKQEQKSRQKSRRR
jgi:16S rRNA processing protein RimM